MSNLSLQHYIGKQATLNQGGLIVEVTIKDARSSYGRVDLLVTQNDAQLGIWVNADRVTVKEA